MVKILLVVPYQEVLEQFRQLVSEVSDPDILIETTHIAGTIDERITACDADIVLARGITFRAIKKALPGTHRVEIAMGGCDVAAALVECLQRYTPARIALLTHDAALANVESMSALCGVPVEGYDVTDEREIDRVLDQALENGAQAFIGGLTACHRCDARGLPRVHIKTGETAIHLAITEAVNAARTINLERAKTRLMQSVLNSSRDVLIAVDRDGLVTALNNQARLLYQLPLSRELSGQPIGNLVGGSEWRKTLETGSETETLRSYDGKSYLLNCKPINVDGRAVGALLTIQSIETIRETESKIRKELSAKGLVAKYHFGNILGESAVMKSRIATAYKYSQVDSNVLISGDTGTGKELFAHSIHNASRRSNQPFVAVNCAALPENLLESELFGYAPGAFSGASKTGKPGLFELAHRGTIFLDEIGEMPISLQAKLLRVLQEKEIRRLGDDRVVPVDVRVVSATNINIGQQIGEGQFRADLYYRLNLLNLIIPPLRERDEDVPVMLSYFLSKFCCDYSKPVPRLTPEALSLLREYDWPGNVRELRNLCERLAVLSDSPEITRELILRLGLLSAEAKRALPKSGPPDEELLRQLSRPRINQTELARRLGISRTTLWRRMSENRQNNNE